MNSPAKHSLTLIGAHMAVALVNYAFGVALSWYFSPAEFGVLGVAQSLLLLTALAVSSGFAWTATHDLASHGPTDETRLRFRAALLANTLLGLALAGGLWLLYRYDLLPFGPAYQSIIPLVGLTTVLLAVRAVLNGAARGLYLFTPIALNLTGEVLVKAALGLALAAAGMGAAGVMAGFALGSLLALFHSLWIIRPVRGWWGRGWFSRQVLSVTAPLFAGAVGVALMLNLDILGLKLLSPPNQADALAGVYQAAVILARGPVFIAQALVLVLFSYAARNAAAPQAEKDSESNFTRTALRSWGRLILPISLVLILAPQPVLSLFFPPQYLAAGRPLQVAAAGAGLLALAALLTGVFQAEGQRRQPALAAGLGIFAQGLILVWLTPGLGAIGAALSLLAAGIVTLAGLTPLLWQRLAALPARLNGLQNPRFLLSYAALAAPLVFLPDGSRWMALFKLSLAGLSYAAALMLASSQPAGNQTGTAPGERPVITLVSRFVHVLMGE